MPLGAPLDRIQPPISKRLTRDVAWNLVSFAIMGLAGIALNVLIASYYDSATLGVFNQVYAIYILLSQVAVAGIQQSVLKHAAADIKAADDILAGALVATAVVAIPVALIGYLGSEFAGSLVKSDAVAQGVRAATPGVLFFAINKVLLSFHNALSRMQAFAAFQSCRFALMIAALLVLTAAAVPGALLPLLFTLAEGTLFLSLVVYTATAHRVRLSAEGRNWTRVHFLFGSRAMWGTLLADVNTRVDILLLGLFVDDRTVGIYSFAALIAEGYSQLAVVFRNVVNPYLAKFHAERTVGELESRLRQGIVMTYRFTVPLGLVLVLAYPLGVRLLGLGSDYLAGWTAFGVLMAGIMAAMGYSAFQMLLNQSGHPGYQSLFFALTFVTNVVLNLVLIPSLGILGSALGTALSFALSILYLRSLVMRAMQLRI